MSAARFDTVPAEARAFHGKPAGIVTRTSANVIDLVVVAVLLGGTYFAVSGVLFLRRGASFRFPVVSYQGAYIAGFVLLVAYFTWCWQTSGRTYGDRVLGLRVHTREGGDLGFWRSLLRAVLCATFPLLLVWVAVDYKSRSVQDLIVRTRVVYDWGGAAPSKPAPSDDAARMAVDVAAPVADEPEDRQAESFAGLDREG
jgi:uncharacterized RDD family membrane protein YckC